MMSRAVTVAAAGGLFHDPEWSQQYMVAFANLYLDALQRYESGATAGLAQAWQVSFDTSRKGGALVVQDLLLGVNAHINHDLAYALCTAGLGANRAIRHHDHEAVNGILSEITDSVQSRIAAMYAPGLANVDAIGGRLDELTTGFSLRAAREAAWMHAIALTTASFDVERKLISRVIERTSALMAKSLLILNADARLLADLRRLEAAADWRDLL